MKKLLLILPLLSVISVAQAEDDFCAAVLSYGVSPEGQCVEFNNACIPADHKRVPSCEDVEDDTRNTSLEERLRARFNGKNRRIQMADTEAEKEAPLARYHRLGRVADTRNFSSARGTEARVLTGADRTSTTKNFSSAFRLHNQKGGFDRGQKTTGHRTSYQRPSFRTTADNKNLDDKISSTPKWSATIQNHFKEKSYGSNPYSLASQRSAQQRAYRAERTANQRVDVKGRILSNSRKWRPGRLDGNLSGDASFLETEADKKATVIEALSEE